MPAALAPALALGAGAFPCGVGGIVADRVTMPMLNRWQLYFGGTASRYIPAVFYACRVGATVLITSLLRLTGGLAIRVEAAHLTVFRCRLDYTVAVTSLLLTLILALWLAKRSGELTQAARRGRLQGRA